jgi:hypothetical protein
MFQADLTENKPNILLDKDGIKLEKQLDGCYYTTFEIINKKLNLVDIINFDLLNLVCELNPDIFESISIDKINEEEANVIIVMKHLFKDLGMQQKYLCLNIQLSCPTRQFLKFTSMSIPCKRPDVVPINAEIMELGRIETICKILTQNHIYITNYTSIDNISDNKTTTFVDKITASMTFKIIKRIIKFVNEYTCIKDK